MCVKVTLPVKEGKKLKPKIVALMLSLESEDFAGDLTLVSIGSSVTYLLRSLVDKAWPKGYRNL